MKCFLKEIILSNFRNFNLSKIAFSSDRVLIIGPNGAGKTSILEAISLLTASKGLRGEKLSHLINSESPLFEIKYDLESFLGNVSIVQSLSHESSKRIIKLNDKKISANELSNFLNIFWLIPQQNILFQESQVDRRKFFDRIVFSFFAEHASEIHKYEHYQRERFKILMIENYDETWLDIIEEKLVILAKSISLRRFEVSNKLNDVLARIDTKFPKVKIEISGKLENIVSCHLNSEEILKHEYLSTRKLDRETHKTSFGALKSDLNVIYINKNQNAFLCSTGEQQACLVSIIIAHTKLFIEERQKKPIILLDELFAHLDEEKRDFLSNYLVSESVQTFVTTTDKGFCSQFAKNAQVISL